MRSKNFAKFSLLTAYTALLTLSAGCIPERADSDSITILQEGVSNGFSINGFSINGFSINGFSINGFSINGFSINGFSINGFSINGLTLGGTLFNGVSSDGQPVSGLNFRGAHAQLTVQPPGQPQPAHYTLRFDNIYVDPLNPNSDVYLYDISYAKSGENTWQNLCLDGDGNPVPAIPILNYWNLQTGARVDDANAVTFACVSGALGKCVRIGYRPWAQATLCANNTPCTTVSLADYHQACTRMIRADYCGNGVSYTLNNTIIDVFDELSPRIQTEAAGWMMEAKWNPGGASCLADARHAELLQDGRSPNCGGATAKSHLPNCGDNHSLKDALLGSTFHDGYLPAR